MSVTSSTETPKKVPPDFMLSVDANLGLMNLPRKTAEGPQDGWYPTSNVTAKLVWMPKLTMSKYVGLMAQAGVWMRTAEFSPDYTKTILRPFAGPVFYAKYTFEDIDGVGDIEVKFVEAPTFFFGVDLNSDENKGWLAGEFGNFASATVTFKDLMDLSVDFHSWYVRSMTLTIKKDVPAVEDGFILGSKAKFSPFKGTDIPVLSDISPYAQYRRWAWDVDPEGMDLPRSWWSEWIGGIEYAKTFSI